MKNIKLILSAATLILDDDVDGAEEGLSKGGSTFHKVRSPRLNCLGLFEGSNKFVLT